MPAKRSSSRRLPPIHPGQILLTEFLQPLAMSQYRLAKDIGVPPKRIGDIVHCRRSITADTALRFSRRFGTSAHFWMNLQTRYDLEVAEDMLRNRLDKEVRPAAA